MIYRFKQIMALMLIVVGSVMCRPVLADEESPYCGYYGSQEEQDAKRNSEQTESKHTRKVAAGLIEEDDQTATIQVDDNKQPAADGAAPAKVDPNPLDELTKQLTSMLGGGNAEINLEKIFQMILEQKARMYKQQLEARERRLNQLPEKEREAVRSAEKAYNNFIQHLNISAVLHGLMTQVLHDLDAMAEQVTDEKIYLLIDKLMESIENNSFSKILYGGVSHSQFSMALGGMADGQPKAEAGMLDIGAMMQPDWMGNDELTDKDLQEIITHLRATRTHFATIEQSLTEKQVHYEEWDRCIELLEQISNKQLYAAAFKAFDALEGLLLKTRKDLGHALDLLAALKVQEEKAINDEYTDHETGIAPYGELQTPGAYWHDQLSRYKRTMNTLFWLTAGTARESLELSEGLLKFITFGNGIAAGFISLYRIDCGSGDNAMVVNDWVIQPAISLWKLFNVRSNVIQEIMTVTMSGEAPIKHYDYMQLFALNAMVVPLLTYLGPKVFIHSKTAFQQVTEKIATSWVYYHLFHCCYFKKSPFIADFEESKLFPFVQPTRNHAVPLWDSRYPHIVDAVKFALEEGRRYLSYEARKAVINSFDPLVLEQAESYSMGIIKPELVSLALRVGTSVAIPGHLPTIKGYSFDSIAHFKPLNDPKNRFGDLYDWSFYSGWRAKEMLEKVDNPEAYYIEAQIFFYVLSCVGGYWGNKLGTAYHKQVYQALTAMLKTAVNGASFIGVFSDSLAEEINEGIIDGAALSRDQLQFMLKDFFMRGTQSHEMIKILLINNNYLASSDAKDDVIVNKAILSAGLMLCAQVGMVKYAQAAHCIQKFMNNPDDIDSVVNELIDMLITNFAGFIGEYVGSHVTQYAGTHIMHNYGPFYPKIKQWVAA